MEENNKILILLWIHLNIQRKEWNMTKAPNDNPEPKKGAAHNRQSKPDQIRPSTV
jgi:hypothetical protein